MDSDDVISKLMEMVSECYIELRRQNPSHDLLRYFDINKTALIVEYRKEFFEKFTPSKNSSFLENITFEPISETVNLFRKTFCTYLSALEQAIDPVNSLN